MANMYMACVKERESILKPGNQLPMKYIGKFLKFRVLGPWLNITGCWREEGARWTADPWMITNFEKLWKFC